MRKVIGEDAAGIKIYEPKNLIGMKGEISSLIDAGDSDGYFKFKWTNVTRDRFGQNGFSLIFIDDDKVVAQNYMFNGEKIWL